MSERSTEIVEALVQLYGSSHGLEEDEPLTLYGDLLADLLHAAERAGAKPAEVLMKGIRCFLEEWLVRQDGCDPDLDGGEPIRRELFDSFCAEIDGHADRRFWV